MTSLEPGPTRTFGGWGPPPRPGRTRGTTRRGLLMLCVASVACLGTASAVTFAVVDGSAHHSRHAGTPGADRLGNTDRLANTVDSLSGIVASSAADRSRVISAIDEVQSCSLAPEQGQAVVESVINDRRAAVARLQRLAAAGPQAGAVVVGDLLTTLNASISDDVSYMSWMGDVARGHLACGGDPMADPNFAAAKSQSDRTNVDKQVFVDAWNPLAARYGQPTYQASDF